MPREEKGMWKDIKGYEDLYQISDDGHVRRIFKGGRTKLLKNREGLYYTVCLSKNCQKHSISIHRLVAEHFLDKPEGKCEVNHKDGNKWNNNVENLEWVTQKENTNHAIKVLGKNPWGKEARKVKCFDKYTGELVAIYPSVSEAARSTGNIYARPRITEICRYGQGTAYGYKWEYAD